MVSDRKTSDFPCSCQAMDVLDVFSCISSWYNCEFITFWIVYVEKIYILKNLYKNVKYVRIMQYGKL